MIDLDLEMLDKNLMYEVFDKIEKKRKGNYNQKDKNNNNYKDGISNYRQKALEHYGRKCQKCGSTKNLVVHHKDGNRHNNNLSNLVVLCWSCHEQRTKRK